MNDFRRRAKALVSKMTLAEKIAQMKYDAPPIERLGVHGYNWWNECLHGVARAGAATVFPQAIGLAASFDTELMKKVANAISDEARAKYNEYKKYGDTLIYQGLTMWSPNINIFRDPRWGRGHETYGEDPYLTGTMGVAFIKGLQGDGKYRKVDATIKHYAAHSGPEDERHEFNTVVSDRDMYETYLWAFKYCIDNADPSAVMGSYNRINGEPACASETYLKGVLYNKFGFDGYVVSDCGAICDIYRGHKAAADPTEAVAMAVNNGCQLNCGNEYQWLKNAVSLGWISEETITDAVERLFTARFRLGMFDDDCEYDNIPYSVVECEKHIALSAEMSRDGMVLLKNDGVLPLSDNMNIAVIGPNADDRSVLLGNYNGTPTRTTTILEGIINACKGRVEYAKGCDVAELKRCPQQPLRDAVLTAKRADVAVMVMGLNPSMEGEQGDDYNGTMAGDKLTLDLPLQQRELYNEIKKTGKPIVFVNVSGSCVNLSEQDKSSNAVIQCFYPGAEGGSAFADILFGKISPSGRLPVTFYKSVEDLPPFSDYSMENRTYKFFKGDVVYPFGYGLTYSDITEEWIDEKTVEITNNGDYDTKYSVLRFEHIPHKNLCGYKKIILRSKEKITITFE